MNAMNRDKDLVDEADAIPQPDITKNLKAKFEAIRNESNPVERPKPRVGRFVVSNTLRFLISEHSVSNS